MKFGTEGERGGETVVSERWEAPTNVELEKSGAGEGGAVGLWERRPDELCFECGGMAVQFIGL